MGAFPDRNGHREIQKYACKVKNFSGGVNFSAKIDIFLRRIALFDNSWHIFGHKPPSFGNNPTATSGGASRFYCQEPAIYGHAAPNTGRT